MTERRRIDPQLRTSLYRVLVRRLESGRPFSWEAAGEHALTLALRTGPPRTDDERASLAKALRVLAATMPAPTEPGVLEAFCEAAAAAAGVPERKGRHPGARLATEEPVPRGARALAEAAVYAEYARATSDDDLVQRAVTRALRERRKSRLGRRVIDVKERGPLRTLLDLPAKGPALVPSSDLRPTLLRGFRSLLERAAPFSEAVMRPALGEDLWARCRPVGFADMRERNVLVEVPSSPLAHELAMMKPELLRRLRTVPGLEGVKDLRFSVRERAFLPLLK